MADLGLRRWRERWGEVGDECGVGSQNSRTRRGTQTGCDVRPYWRRGTPRRARAPGGAAEAGGILMARLPCRVSHECSAPCAVLVRSGSAVTVHIARRYRLREQADAHGQPAAGGRYGQRESEADAPQSDGCSREVNQSAQCKINTPDGAVFLPGR
jgi:hypothetical protein